MRSHLPLFRELSWPKSIHFNFNPCNREFCVRVKDLLMQISQQVQGSLTEVTSV